MYSPFSLQLVSVVYTWNIGLCQSPNFVWTQKYSVQPKMGLLEKLWPELKDLINNLIIFPAGGFGLIFSLSGYPVLHRGPVWCWSVTFLGLGMEDKILKNSDRGLNNLLKWGYILKLLFHSPVCYFVISAIAPDLGFSPLSIIIY